MYIKCTCEVTNHPDFYTTEFSSKTQNLQLNGDYNIPIEKVPIVIVNFLQEQFPFTSKEIFEKAIENKSTISFPIKVKTTDNMGNIIYSDCKKDENGDFEQMFYFDGENYKLIEEYWWGWTRYETSFKILEKETKETINSSNTEPLFQ